MKLAGWVSEKPSSIIELVQQTRLGISVWAASGSKSLHHTLGSKKGFELAKPGDGQETKQHRRAEHKILIGNNSQHSNAIRITY
jgi:hypothetical protein